jgi:hypothetical protein
MREDELGRTCGTHGGERKFINGVVRKPEEKRPLGNPRRRLEYCIKMDLEVIGKDWTGLDWTHVAQNKDKWRAVVSTVMNLKAKTTRRKPRISKYGLLV